jgi:hypothetical protein
MSEDERRRPEETTPPGPQPEDAPFQPDEYPDSDAGGRGTGVDKKSADSFPASDPPSW